MHKMEESTAPRIHLAVYIGGGHPIQKLVLKDKWVSKSRNGARSIHQYQGIGPGHPPISRNGAWGIHKNQEMGSGGYTKIKVLAPDIHKAVSHTKHSLTNTWQSYHYYLTVPLTSICVHITDPTVMRKSIYL